MALIRQLLTHWPERLRRVREIAASSSDSWLWQLQERVLTFLISRYSQSDHGVDWHSGVEIVRTPVKTFGLVEPQDAPPRTVCRLTPLMYSIHAANEQSRAAQR